jgi:hypothetical protein
MPWPPFNDTTNAPKIMTEGYRYTDAAPFTIVSDSSSPTGYSREISEVHYEFRWLTFAAADSIAAARKSLSSPAHKIDASWFRMSDNGAYGVRVIEKIVTMWTPDS